MKKQHLELHIFAKPNAKKTVLLKVDDQGLHISLHAKPHQGEANKELIAYLAKLFRIPKSQIELKRGEGGRYKVVSLPENERVRELMDDPESFINKAGLKTK